MLGKKQGYFPFLFCGSISSVPNSENEIIKKENKRAKSMKIDEKH